MPKSSPWMTAATSFRFLASMTGTWPAPIALRHDRNSIVGMIDTSAMTTNSENFVRKAWPIVIRPFLQEKHADQPDEQQRAGSDAKHHVGDLQPARGG